MATISIPDEVIVRLDQLASSREQPTADLVARAVAEFLEREAVVIDDAALQALRAEGRESWAAYQRDGLHLTGEEVDAWLASWGTPQETPAPKCHV